MTGFFGLAFLPSNDVENSFVEDYMSDAPNNKKCSEFADYLTLTYITQESLFPPKLWAEKPSDMKRTNNGPESFHCHYNEQFYTSHPSIYQFLEVLIGQQTFTCIDEIHVRTCSYTNIRKGENRIHQNGIRDVHHWRICMETFCSIHWFSLQGQYGFVNSFSDTVEFVYNEQACNEIRLIAK